MELVYICLHVCILCAYVYKLCICMTLCAAHRNICLVRNPRMYIHVIFFIRAHTMYTCTYNVCIRACMFGSVDLHVGMCAFRMLTPICRLLRAYFVCRFVCLTLCVFVCACVYLSVTFH